MTIVLFLEFPDVQLHYDPMFNSLYIIGSCRFCLYFFGRRDFSIPLFHPAFDPSVPYFSIPLHVAHHAPPLAPAASPPTSPAQVVPDPSLGSDSDPSEATNSPSSSSGPDADYTLAEPGMANSFMSK